MQIEKDASKEGNKVFYYIEFKGEMKSLDILSDEILLNFERSL